MSEAIITILQSSMLSQHPRDAARQIEDMPIDSAAALLNAQDPIVEKDIWQYLAKDILWQIFQYLHDHTQVQVLNALSIQDAYTIWKQLDDAQQTMLAPLLDTTRQFDFQTMEGYPEDSIASLVEFHAPTLRQDMTIKDALARLKKAKRRPWRVIYLLNELGEPIEYVDVADLALGESDQFLSDISRPVRTKLPITMSQDDAVEALMQVKIKDIAVVNEQNIFMGVIEPEQIIKTTREEISADIGLMVGVTKSEHALSGVWFSVSRRLPWLNINLATAFLAAAVVGYFEPIIAEFTALAVLLPVVAGQSGNTGAQALAIIMRGLTLKEITLKQSFKVLFKEGRVALINGIAIAIVTALAVYFWSGQWGLAFVIAISMIIAMMIAALSGAAVPLLLARFGLDPAQSASIILTTVTDVFGFMSFLGIATAFASIL